MKTSVVLRSPCSSLSRFMIAALTETLRSVADDKSIRVVVLGANGPGFCAGHDMKEMTARRSDPDRGRAYFKQLMDSCSTMMQTIVHLPKPVIAVVQGAASAAGCQLVASCDLAIASSAAKFATPGVNIGLFCSTPMVPVERSIGRKRALEMLFTGELIDAETALAWGLVNRVVPADRLAAEVRDLADRIASASPAVLALGKRAFYEQDGVLERAAYDLACAVMVDNAQADDAHEGMRAFLEKRKPEWRAT